MKYKLSLISPLATTAIAGALLASVSARADVVYSSGTAQTDPPGSLLGPSPDNIGGVTLQDNFTLAQNSRLTGVEVWTVDSADGDDGFLEQMQYGIYSGVSAPTTLLASGTVNNAGFSHVGSFQLNDNPNPDDDENIFTQTFDFASTIHLSAGVNYWFVWSGQIDIFAVDAQAYWDPIVGNTGANGYGDRAFDLFGSVVPVPDTASTAALLGLALAAIVYARRRDSLNLGIH